MKEVERHSCQLHDPQDDRAPWATMAPHKRGDWVRFSDYDSLLRKFAEVERDAARYRWLRERQCGLELDPQNEGLVFSVPLNIYETRKVGMNGSDVDAAIDSAMPGEGK